METAAKLMMLGGVMLALGGLLLWLMARLGLGSLPGDILIQGNHVKIVIPLASMLLLRVLLTIVLNVALRLWR